MKHKYLFIGLAITSVISANARAESVDKNGILRNSSGKMLTMNQVEAIKACARHGMHLPTIRELLIHTAGMIIKEPTEVTDGELRIGAFKPLSATNPNGKVDRFYYDSDNFASLPAGNWGEQEFWSSSLDDDSFGYYLEGRDGNVDYTDNEDVTDNGAPAWFAVRCLPGK
jgi:hypothetical protein